MSIIKRLYTTVSATVDQLVGDIENHDALIAATIRERHKKLAAARVQLKRLQERESRAGRELAELEDKHQQWQQRAQRLAKEDEARALSCLQQRQGVAAQIGRLQQHRQQYREASQRMAADISRCEEQLQQLTRKYELFRARQSSSEALATVNDMGGALCDDIGASFERWDAVIIERELSVEPVDDNDLFEQAFIDEENSEALQRELEQLRSAVDKGEDIQRGEGERHE